MSEAPSAPIEQLEDIDSRLLEKLALLEEKEGRAMVDPEEFSSLSREEQLKVSILDYLGRAH